MSCFMQRHMVRFSKVSMATNSNAWFYRMLCNSGDEPFYSLTVVCEPLLRRCVNSPFVPIITTKDYLTKIINKKKHA